MELFNFFKRAAVSHHGAGESQLQTSWTMEGVRVEFSKPLDDATTDALIDAIHSAGPCDTVLGVYIAQLVNEGLCCLEADAALIAWPEIYDLQGSDDHAGVLQLLGLPPTGELRPILGCENSLSDASFELEVSGWTDGLHPVSVDDVSGAVVTVEGAQQMLPVESWETLNAIDAFAERMPSERTQRDQELAWGRIRGHADRAGALYENPYLETTYVLTPESLRLPLSRDETPFGRVLTVAPTFEGAPKEWLNTFDGFNSVQSHYDITRGSGRVRVVISDPVKKVLEVIKREMPGRQVSGAKAQKFIHNPWAFLGETAHKVISEEDFQRDRAEAGAVASVFSIGQHSDSGRITYVDLTVTEHFGDGTIQTNREVFANPEQLDQFLAALQGALKLEREQFAWDEFDLSIDGEATAQLELGQQVSHLWRNQPAERISFDDIYELDGYSGRIEGIGVARPIYVPVFQREAKESDDETVWQPKDLTPMVKVVLQGGGGGVLIPLTPEWVDQFCKEVEDAERQGKAEVTNGSLPTPIATAQARTLVTSFKSMLDAGNKVKADQASKPSKKKDPRETLLVKTNFHGIDYLESRRVSLAMTQGSAAKLPRSLRSGIFLKEHQTYGVAWFQNLVSKAPAECRGALLADDMGLGKTLQLLALLAWYYEEHPEAPPSVIFAPKSLVDNWANEVTKFFTPSFPETLVLYGDELSKRKQPLGLIDNELHSKGIVDLLRPGWVGTAKVIITTYEVLTNYEFSFAKQQLAFMICDEAQRIKTPGALVTLAAKKLKANFRIACTGTPVENSLVDLWCLFDFVQPGLLGALEDFGKNYRRPIECETDAQEQALKKLQDEISPQTLRRTKLEIASELPDKYFAVKPMNAGSISFQRSMGEGDRLEIELTNFQRILYKAGLKKLQEAASEINGRKRARLSFGALHLMKAVCAEPYCLPGTKFLPDVEGTATHLSNSPKLNWLLECLEEIRQKNEKAIIFTELREAQLALFYFLRERFGLKPFIINGDSQNRQSKIDSFSEKAGFDVIILSTLAAGAGLNVTAANHVFHFTRAWNSSKESQATDRAFRIGQSRDVYVYCPTVVSDDFITFEVRLDQLLKRKAGLADATLDLGGLATMLNGTGNDASWSDFSGSADGGEPLPKRDLTMDDIDRMDGEGFEVLCCLLWRKREFQSQVTNKHGGDGGIDIVALKGHEGDLIQCKSSKSRELGWDAIKEVVAGAARYQAQYARTQFRRIAVTNQRFTSGARIQAEANGAVLVERAQLADMLARYPVNNHEFEEEFS